MEQNEKPIPKTRCIESQQYSLEEIYKLCKLAEKVRELEKTERGADFLASLLRHIRAMLYFHQSSSRTFLSFTNACHILGIKMSEIRDLGTSSFAKGESELDGVRTFEQYIHLLIMRHSSAQLIYDVSDHLKEETRVINAGSGSDQHPTQALLDFYTINRYGFENKNIAFIGDLLRGRTVRSLALMLSKLPEEMKIKLYFVAPEVFQIQNDITDYLKDNNVEFELTENWENLIPEVDVAYMTRLQDEYKGVHVDLDRSKYGIDQSNISNFKEDAIILHPLPRREEIDSAVDEDKRAKYWEQVENGLWVRVALIASMFDKEDKIMSCFDTMDLTSKSKVLSRSKN